MTEPQRQIVTQQPQTLRQPPGQQLHQYYGPPPQPQPKPGGSGCFKWVFLLMVGCLGVLGFTVIVPLIGAFLGISAFTAVVNDVIDFVAPAPRAEVQSSQTILRGIQPLGQLVSISTQLAKADIRVAVRAGIQNVCGHSAHHVAQGTVEAGIDLSLVTEDNIDYNRLTNTYTIHLPPPQLTSCRIDFIRQYDRSSEVCSIDWDEVRLLANNAALDGFRDDALEGGILTRAQDEATGVIGGFVQSLTGANVEIVYDQLVTPAIPASCMPEAPAGWTNVGGDTWQKN